MPPDGNSRARFIRPAYLLLPILAAILCGCPTSVQPESPPAQRRLLTIDNVFGRNQLNFDGSYARGLRWDDDGQHYLQRRGGELMRIHARTGKAETEPTERQLRRMLLEHPGFSEQHAQRLARRPVAWTSARDAALLSHSGALYFADLTANRIRKLAGDGRERRLAALSANGKAVSFVRGNNLFTLDTHRGHERQITHDGNAITLNGVLDWVYQEEIYGRGRWSAAWWRDDAKHLAFLRLDVSPVPQYAIANFMPHAPEIERRRYPKAGDANPVVRLGIADGETGRVVWADLARYDHSDILIVRVSWSPGGQLLFSVQDREQRWLELNQADPLSGQTRVLIRESSPAWASDAGHPYWLSDGSFLWLSDRDGHRHIYHYSRTGALRRRLTRGAWSVNDILGCDPQMNFVYFSGSVETPVETHAYRCPLRGGPVEQLTPSGHTHRVSLDPAGQLFLDTYSSCTSPPQVALRSVDGSLVRAISENKVKALREYEWSPPEILPLENRAGLPFSAMLIRPPDFDPQRSYPVYCAVYGAPGAPTVHNRWGGSGQVFHQYLAQRGCLVWRCDPHSATPGRPVAHWQAYRRLGQAELSDIEDGLNWLIAQGYADPNRILIEGGSYGGYVAAYALTHSRMFSAGIAQFPVTDWRNYDSVYTERYMQTPAHNEAGYQAASVVWAAEQLHGDLLLTHGIRDDNVHFQNSVQLIEALQRHKQPFELMIYPKDRHGIGRGRNHHDQLRLRFIEEHLFRDPPGTS